MLFRSGGDGGATLRNPKATATELLALCTNGVHGPIDDPPDNDPAALRAKVVGRWFNCNKPGDPGGTGGYDFVVWRHENGIELASDGTWHSLRAMPDGSFDRLNGIGNEGTWSVTSDQNGRHIMGTDGNPWGTEVQFERGPVRMFTYEGGTGGSASQWHVRIP